MSSSTALVVAAFTAAEWVMLLSAFFGGLAGAVVTIVNALKGNRASNIAANRETAREVAKLTATITQSPDRVPTSQQRPVPPSQGWPEE